MRALSCPHCGHAFPAPSASLTDVQARLLRFLCDTIDARGAAPTCDEIAAEFGYKSLGTVVEHLQHLEQKGFIVRVQGKRQAITVLFRDPGARALAPVVEHDESERAQPARLAGIHT